MKIDKTFVESLTEAGGDEPITRAVIGLAHSLGLRVLTEGVETRIQEDFLRREGCHEAQGYLYDRPLPAEQLLERWGQRPASESV